jgi:lipid II:glycine glycyltransferase (peptidoglycan interpeptide bridge formation enzyme)
MSQVDLSPWHEFIHQHPDAHLLQSGYWGELKASFGWIPYRLLYASGGMQVLVRNFPLGFRMAYIPKGPVGEIDQSFWEEVNAFCQNNRIFLLKIEPDVWQSQSTNVIKNDSHRIVGRPVQPRRTIVVNLDGNEDVWLSRMKQKTRYNIRLAEKKGVIVQSSDNLNLFYELLKTTGRRDKFGIHAQGYFQRAYELFSPGDQCVLLVASYEGNPLAAIIVFRQGKRAWYFYGASNNEERERMPTYLLQWEALRWAKQGGCLEYDLWGVPDEEEDTLEEQFLDRTEGLWGVYRFKRGFGGVLVRSIGAWDCIYDPFRYRLYKMISHIKNME